MTLTRFFTVFILSSFLTMVSCKEEKPKVIIDNNTAAAVPHYICANECENSGSNVAGVCQTCNEALLHNDAFHAKDFLKNGPLNVPKYNEGQPATSTTQSQSPAQNSQGIYHYTCNNGCNGGAGSAGKCKVCGNDLAHNQAYHN